MAYPTGRHNRSGSPLLRILLINTSLPFGVGISTSSTLNTSGDPYPVRTTAFMFWMYFTRFTSRPVPALASGCAFQKILLRLPHSKNPPLDHLFRPIVLVGFNPDHLESMPFCFYFYAFLVINHCKLSPEHTFSQLERHIRIQLMFRPNQRLFSMVYLLHYLPYFVLFAFSISFSKVSFQPIGFIRSRYCMVS